MSTSLNTELEVSSMMNRNLTRILVYLEDLFKIQKINLKKVIFENQLEILRTAQILFIIGLPIFLKLIFNNRKSSSINPYNKMKYRRKIKPEKMSFLDIFLVGIFSLFFGVIVFTASQNYEVRLMCSRISEYLTNYYLLGGILPIILILILVFITTISSFFFRLTTMICYFALCLNTTKVFKNHFNNDYIILTNSVILGLVIPITFVFFIWNFKKIALAIKIGMIRIRGNTFIILFLSLISGIIFTIFLILLFFTVQGLSKYFSLDLEKIWIFASFIYFFLSLAKNTTNVIVSSYIINQETHPLNDKF